MRALNNKELEEVEGEQESSSASERSPIGPGDLAPVRYVVGLQVTKPSAKL